MSDTVPSTTPPGHRYRLLTGPDDATFCSRVSGALEEGYELYGTPSVTFDGQRVVVAQAVLWPGPVTPATAAASTPAATGAATGTPATSTASPTAVAQNGDDR